MRNAQVVCARDERQARSSRLRNPPQLADPRILADHHALAQVIHERRTRLRGNINRIGIGKRLHKRIGFPSVSAGYRLARGPRVDRKSTRLNSSHMSISYAVFCLKKKTYSTTAPHSSTRRKSSS